MTIATDGLPPFGVWLVLFSLCNAIHVAVFPSGISLALEPMGEMAGTAASVLGFGTWMLGSLLASFTDRAIDGSVMPIGIAYLDLQRDRAGLPALGPRWNVTPPPGRRLA